MGVGQQHRAATASRPTPVTTGDGGEVEPVVIDGDCHEKPPSELVQIWFIRI